MIDERQEILEVCDRHNRIIGRATRGVIHRLGLRHRAVHIFVFDGSGRLYLQLRRDHKDQYPRHWDTSAAGHVSPGESYADAAARELEEELGIREDLAVLAEVPASPENGWEHLVLFYCQSTSELMPNPAEIETGAFFTMQEIDQMLGEADRPFTPAFRLLYHWWRRRGAGDPDLQRPKAG